MVKTILFRFKNLNSWHTWTITDQYSKLQDLNYFFKLLSAIQHLYLTNVSVVKTQKLMVWFAEFWIFAHEYTASWRKLAGAYT